MCIIYIYKFALPFLIARHPLMIMSPSISLIIIVRGACRLLNQLYVVTSSKLRSLRHHCTHTDFSMDSRKKVLRQGNFIHQKCIVSVFLLGDSHYLSEAFLRSRQPKKALCDEAPLVFVMLLLYPYGTIGVVTQS